MLKEAGETEIGKTIEVPIERSRDHVYLQPDTMAALTGPSGGLELVLLVVQGVATVQTLEVIEGTGGATTKGLRAGPVSSDAKILEVAAVRLSPQLALEMIGIAADQMLKAGVMSVADIDARMKAALDPHRA